MYVKSWLCVAYESSSLDWIWITKESPLELMPNLLAVAEYITKVHAICPHCGNLATHSYRKSEDEFAKRLLGEKKSNQPRCRTCYQMGNNGTKNKQLITTIHNGT